MNEAASSVGILFADIAGSMKLYEALGNEDAHAAIEKCCGLLGRIVEMNDGAVVKTIGDEVMAAFPDRVRTWTAAVQMQTRINALEPLASPRGPMKLGLRVGFEYGAAIAKGGDYFGDTVNVAARMAQLAKRGQIITTGNGQALPSPDQSFTTRNLDWLAVKGKPDGMHVIEVIWQQDKHGHTTLMDLPSFAAPKPIAGIDLRLEIGDKAWLCDDDRPSVTIGRDLANTVVLTNTAASRNHATIERRRGKWVLVDHSSNGTFLTVAGRELHLRHEESILTDDGNITFGAPAFASPIDSRMTFVVERVDPSET